jgi:O-antigen/teichoic acid export membrane protein
MPARSCAALAAASQRWTWLHNPAVYTFSVPILSVAGSVTTVIAPMLLDPIQFGRFVIMASIFQYVADFDLGLSRLTDRIIPQHGDSMAGDLLGTRVWLGVGLWLGALLISLSLFDNSWQTIIALSAGLMFMVSNGAVAIHRAGHRVGEFTIAALSLQLGLSLPRLLGLLVGGVNGCFAALLVWYSMTAVALLSPRPRLRARHMVRFIGDGLPLFAFNTCWLLYLLCNRWIAALLSTPRETGLFGFGATLVTIGVGMVSTIAQVHYPKYLSQANKPRFVRESSALLGVTGVGVAVGMIACRYLVPILFPVFADGADAAAAIVVTSVPLNLCGWLIPLVIAKTENPWREAGRTFGVAFLSLMGGMAVGGWLGGVAGLAWGCLPSGLLLLLMQCRHLVRAGLLDAGAGYRLALSCGLAVVFGLLEWCMLFPHV